MHALRGLLQEMARHGLMIVAAPGSAYLVARVEDQSSIYENNILTKGNVPELSLCSN